MANVLQTPAECLFFSDVLLQVAEPGRPAVALQLARALSSHGMQANEWKTDTTVSTLLNEVCRHTGAAWLPDAMLPVVQQSTATEIKAALVRRTQIGGRQPSAILSEAEEQAGAVRVTTLSLLDDAIRAGQIKGTYSDDDAAIARALARFLNAAKLPWAAAKPEVDAVEAQCRAVTQRNDGHAEARVLLGRTLLRRASMSNDRDAVAILRESMELLAAPQSADPPHGAWPAVEACARLCPRTPKAEAMSVLARAAAVLNRPDGPPSGQYTLAKIEFLLAWSNIEDDQAARQRFAEAMDLAASLPPDSVAALRARGRILLYRADREPKAEAQKSYLEASHVLESLAVLEPSDYDGQISYSLAAGRLACLASPSEAARLFDTAEKLVRTAIALDPDRPEGYSGLLALAEWRAEALGGAQRTAIIETTWNDVSRQIEKFEGFGNFRRRLGRLKAAQAGLQSGTEATSLAVEAAQHFEAAAALLPSDVNVVENWARALLWQARMTESESLLKGAIAKFQEALELRPNNKWGLSGWAQALTAIMNVPVEREIANCEEAIGKYGEALQGDPGFRDAILGRADVRSRLSRLKTRPEALKILEESLKEMEAFVASNAADGWAFEVLGTARYTLAERTPDDRARILIEGALVAYRRALELRPDRLELHNYIGDTLRAQAERAGASELFDRAMEAYKAVPPDAGPTSVRAQIGMGITASQRTWLPWQSDSQWKTMAEEWLGEALGSFTVAIGLAPQNAVAHRWMAVTMMRMWEINPGQPTDLEKAEEHLQEALKLRPGDPNSLTLLGDVYRARAASKDNDAKLPLLGRADEQYEAAIKILPDYYYAWMGAGRSAVDRAGIAGVKSLLYRAVEQFERALQSKPGDRAAQSELDAVRKRLLESPSPRA